MNRHLIKRHVRYPVIHWVLTLFIAPVIIGLFGFIGDGMSLGSSLKDGFAFGVLIILMGAVFSLPTVVLYAIYFTWMRSLARSKTLILLVGNALVLVLMGISMYILGGYMMPWLFAGFSVALLLAGLVLRPGAFLDRKLALWKDGD